MQKVYNMSFSLLYSSQAKVDCITVNLMPVKAVIDDHIQRLFDALVNSLRKAINNEVNEIDTFVTSAMDTLSQRPQTVEEIGDANAKHTEFAKKKQEVGEIPSRLPPCQYMYLSFPEIPHPVICTLYSVLRVFRWIHWPVLSSMCVQMKPLSCTLFCPACVQVKLLSCTVSCMCSCEAAVLYSVLHDCVQVKLLSCTVSCMCSCKATVLYSVLHDCVQVKLLPCTVSCMCSCKATVLYSVLHDCIQVKLLSCTLYSVLHAFRWSRCLRRLRPRTSCCALWQAEAWSPSVSCRHAGTSLNSWWRVTSSWSRNRSVAFFPFSLPPYPPPPLPLGCCRMFDKGLGVNDCYEKNYFFL